MSEYQYYEFQAVDRPLTEREMRELRAVSTRATISSTRFVNHYEWGDFKGNPSRWMEKYFDAFLYLANWGTHELMLRLPRTVLDVREAQRYCRGELASAWATDDFVILAFHSDEEGGGGWIDDDGDGWLGSLIPLRAEIAAGDHRALYLAWLLDVQEDVLDEDETEPPVPPGLATPTAAQQAFAEFLRIDADLLAAAAERSPAAREEPDRAELEAWIATLPPADKDRLLVRAAAGEAPQLRAELLRRFREERAPAAPDGAEPRTVGELLDAARTRAEQRRREEAARAARERARREREQAEARERHLDTLALREAESWRRVDELIATRQPKSYDEAASLLRDLRDLCARDGRAADADARIQALREQHAKKPTLLRRLDALTEHAAGR